MSCRTVEGCSYTCLHRFSYTKCTCLHRFNDVHMYQADMQLTLAEHALIRGASAEEGGEGSLDEPTMLVCN